MSKSLTPVDALIYVMITMSAVDRKISDNELSRIGSIVKELPAFSGLEEDWLSGAAQQCGKLLAKADGLDKVLGLVKAALPEHLCETAYVLAAEVAATDLQVGPEKVRFLEMLAVRLGLDKLTCAALERAARARHQRA